MTPPVVFGRSVDVAREGHGRDLLLLHSLLADRSAFDRIVPELARRFRVTLPNLPGYGASAAQASLISIERYADWIAELFVALELAPDTAVLGNGLGGFIAVALAVRHGAMFGPLIVADALPAFPAAGKEPLRALAARVRTEGMSGALDAAIRRMFPDSYIAAHPLVIEERKRALATADPDAFQRACYALAALDLTPDLGAITNRTLVLVGSEDRTTPPEVARHLATGIPGAHWVEIADCGHCPQIQQPRELVAVIDRFLG